MLDIQLAITLTLRGPVLSQSTAAGAYGVDAPAARTADGTLYLPWTLVKGQLRQAWLELQEAAGHQFRVDVSDLLGERTGEEGHESVGVEPHRGRLQFGHFYHQPVATGVREEKKERIRIRLDSTLGSVERGAFQVLETPFKPGEKVTFTGHVRFCARDAAEASEIERLVRVGFRWIPNLGSGRTHGFGRLEGVTMEQEILPAVSVAPRVEQSVTSLWLEITPEGPFCIARKRVTENLFEGEEVLPGSVLLGSLVTSWQSQLGKRGGAITPDMDPAREALCRNFSAIRMTHAFPCPAGSTWRPVYPPESLVKVKGREGYYDVALESGPGLLHGKAPEFRVDWKQDSDVLAEFGWLKWVSEGEDPSKGHFEGLSRELLVRTAMDREKRRAKDENLFAYEMVLPGDFVWRARVDLHQVDSGARRQVASQLVGLLEAGFRELGKTKVRARVRVLAEPPSPKVEAETKVGQEGPWIVTLQTPSLLCDPAALEMTTDPAKLFRAYSAAFKQLSCGTNNETPCLELKRYFARQSLAGGFYLHKRFRASSRYTPYLLTNPGSVFILFPIKGQESRASACVQAWLELGLPLPDWAKSRYKAQQANGWATCPYRPENGFGEIAVNLNTHWSRKPEVYHAL